MKLHIKQDLTPLHMLQRYCNVFGTWRFGLVPTKIIRRGFKEFSIYGSFEEVFSLYPFCFQNWIQQTVWKYIFKVRSCLQSEYLKEITF